MLDQSTKPARVLGMAWVCGGLLVHRPYGTFHYIRFKTAQDDQWVGSFGWFFTYVANASEVVARHVRQQSL
jgi:hypothetical protein